MSAPGDARIAAELFLDRLAAHGVDWFFANAGTDFPPIVEAFARRGNAPRPRPIVVPHENAAVAMAHGAYLVTGRPQAVMVHVNVGTGNTLNTLINASRDRVPMLLAAGRTPITEAGHHGGRSRYIHWAQEMFDQAGMVREVVKWDYELRVPSQVEDVVDRALEVAMTAPRGPVYLTLPREVIAGPVANGPGGPPRRPPAGAHPSPAAIDALADWVTAASSPLIIAADVGRTAAGVEALQRLAARFGLPVVTLNPRQLCLPASHPMFQGYQVKPLLAEADLVIVVECDVPWLPALEPPPPSCRVVHIGEDPAYQRYPMRSFRSDLAITSDAASALEALAEALAGRLAPDDAAVAARRQLHAVRSAERRAAWRAAGEAAANRTPIAPEWISRCIADLVDDQTLVVNEYPLRLEQCGFERPGAYFGLSPAGGLGWGLGAALGAKLAAPERTVIATLGDGAYVFANPTACHWVAAAHRLPVMTVVFNNALYGAVRNATLAMYRDGAAAAGDGRLLADLSPSPDFARVIEASGGHGERVERPEDLPAALARALHAVRVEGRQALVDVVCGA